MPASPRLLLSTLFWGLGVWILTLAASAPGAAQMKGTPTVLDGDTIELQGQRIRLFGIDAPELGQDCQIKGQSYDCGMVARTALLDLTAGSDVICKVVPADPNGVSAEGRPGRCFAGNYDLSEGMAYTGWALAEREVSERYVIYEARAKDSGRGLWKGQFVMPWEWRGGKRLSEKLGTE